MRPLVVPEEPLDIRFEGHGCSDGHAGYTMEKLILSTIELAGC